MPPRTTKCAYHIYLKAVCPFRCPFRTVFPRGQTDALHRFLKIYEIRKLENFMEAVNLPEQERVPFYQSMAREAECRYQHPTRGISVLLEEAEHARQALQVELTRITQDNENLKAELDMLRAAPAQVSAPAEGQNPGVPQEHVPSSSHSGDTNQETLSPYINLSSLAPGPSNVPSTQEIVAGDDHGNDPPNPNILEECPICLEEFDARNPAHPTKCGHLFHPPCLRELMERSKACPVCNQDMDPTE